MRFRGLTLLLLAILFLAPRPFHAQYYSARVWVDREELYVGEEFRIYFQVSHRSYVRITSHYSGGSRVVYEGHVDPGTYYVRAHAAEPAGLRTIWLEMYVNGLPVAWEYCIINVLSNEKNTYYREKVLPVMRIEQPGKDCWAAALAMAVYYHLSKHHIRISPQALVSFIHYVLNVPFPEGLDTRYFYWAEKILWNKYNLWLDLDPVYILTWYDVKKEIDNARPLVVFISFYNPYENKWAGHAVVIAGYKESFLAREILIIDPSEWFPEPLGKGRCHGDHSGSWCDWELINNMLGVAYICRGKLHCILMKGVRVVPKG